MIEPPYDQMVLAALEDEKLYAMAALIDVIRVGRVREWKLAMEELKKWWDEWQRKYTKNQSHAQYLED